MPDQSPNTDSIQRRTREAYSGLPVPATLDGRVEQGITASAATFHPSRWRRAPFAMALIPLVATAAIAAALVAVRAPHSPPGAASPPPIAATNGLTSNPVGTPPRGTPTAPASPSARASSSASPQTSGGPTSGLGPTATPPPPGWPDASNTGPAPGGLTSASGDITLSTGQSYSRITLSGCITITGSNVTVIDVRITMPAGCVNAISVNSGLTGVVLNRIEIIGTGNAPASSRGIFGGTFSASHVNVHAVNTGFWIDSGTIADSYAHALITPNGYPAEAIRTSSTTGPVDVEHNNLDGGGGDGTVALYGPISNITVNHNLLNGAGYCLYGGDGPTTQPTTNIVVTNNHFGRADHPTCGYYGPAEFYNPSDPGNRWTGNVWDDTGATLGP